MSKTCGPVATAESFSHVGPAFEHGVLTVRWWDAFEGEGDWLECLIREYDSADAEPKKMEKGYQSGASLMQLKLVRLNLPAI